MLRVSLLVVLAALVAAAAAARKDPKECEGANRLVPSASRALRLFAQESPRAPRQLRTWQRILPKSSLPVACLWLCTCI